MMNNDILYINTLHLADDALILGQRNSEWTGHGPVLEQDIAITNIALDLLGQARNFYQYAVLLYNSMLEKEKKKVDRYIPVPWKKYNRELNEDDLAFLRKENQYLNCLLVELPNGDWGKTILRQFFFSNYQFFLYQQIQKNSDAQLAAIAEKSLKEISYHVRWSSEWVVRLGDGTEESNERIKKSVDELWPFTGELFQPSGYELLAAKQGFSVDIALIKESWLQKVTEVLTEATLSVPSSEWMQSGGKEGKHTEHLGYILSEMQNLQRTYPDSTW